MSGFYNQKLKRSLITTHDLPPQSRAMARHLIKLNRCIDPKRGYEQSIVAREIALGNYMNADTFSFAELPERLFVRGPERTLRAMLDRGSIRIETISHLPQLNHADLPDTPQSPYLLVLHNSLGSTSLPITLGQRALVFRASLDPYVYLQYHRSCVSINDPAEFVSCVTEKLDQVWGNVGGRVVRVLHAPCFYQWSRLVGTWQERSGFDESFGIAEDAKYFIKPGYGFHDAEFRFVWILDRDFEGHVDVQCPDLPKICSPFTEEVR